MWLTRDLQLRILHSLTATQSFPESGGKRESYRAGPPQPQDTGCGGRVSWERARASRELVL